MGTMGEKRNYLVRCGVLLGLVGAAAGAGLYGASALPVSRALPGLRVDGAAAPDRATAAELRAFVDERAKALLARKVRLTLDGREVRELDLQKLGVEVDVVRTVELALSLSRHEGDDPWVLWEKVENARRASAGGIDVPLVVRVDRDRVLPIFEELKEVEDVQPVSARLDLEKHETVPERDGRYIDADGALAAIEAFARDPLGQSREAIRVVSPKDAGKSPAIELPIVRFAPRVSSAFLKSLDISKVVAEYETFFSRRGDQSRRGKNIDNAAQKLDGVVLSPGELMSFNQIVGERSESNGFQKSWEIFKGEMVEGVGGGTCQVASTFHAAAFFGGLEVLERLPHSRPSGYIPMGLDSTVVYPAVDLKVRNPHPFPVVIHAKTEGAKLRVELLGKERPVEVGFGRDLLETLPYKRKIMEESWLTGRKIIVKQHGIRGFRIRRTRKLRYSDGTVRFEKSVDTYPPTTEIFQVPVGFDQSLLPKLPHGEGEPDPDNPASAPASASTPSPAAAPSTAAVSPAPAGETPSVEMVDAPGAHAPTRAQRDPAKNMWLGR